MKGTMLSLLLFALTTYFSLSFSTELVRDTNGNAISVSTKVYIQPPIFGAAGGGVRLGETGNSTCPLTVIQDYSELVNGLHVSFGHFILIQQIFTDIPLVIAFSEKPECAESSKWVVVEDDFPKPWVSIGGSEDLKGKHIINGYFKIVEHVHGFGYNIVFCDGICHDIGRYNDENGWRLILTENDPFEVVFENANIGIGRSVV
ncbi:hypothetical protein TSUD_294180 [Trifolium subterraneum]|uniref:Kunitz type trypsin inhibitor / Alpha-fucosidase n=1 Tax=Trifolium subterraneum TaxID=3900 RepID=A0A2Z6MMI9_TRISU|nr:hypothetical protein TSUD_294180 [Trifolium subterraneum]